MAKKYPKLSQTLKRLLFERNMKPTDLSREVKIPQPTIHRLVTGASSRPYRSSLQPIADFFSISLDELLGEKDVSDLSNESKEISSHKIHYIPLLPMADLLSGFDPNKYEKIPFAGIISNKAYATILDNSAMEPLFNRGSILIFDPEKIAKDRSYVLVKLSEAETPIFRQLLIDAEVKYLKPLNPDLNIFKMRILDDKDKILAALVEARQIYNEDF